MSYYQQQLQNGGYMVPQLGTPGATNIDPNDPLVYLGVHSVPAATASDPYMHVGIGDTATTKAPDTATASQMLDNLDHMSIKEQHKLYAQLLIAGYSGTTIPLDKIADMVTKSAFVDVESSYKLFLQELSDRYSTRNQKITPDELLKQRIDFRFKSEGVDWNGKLNSINLDFLSSLSDPATDLSGTRTSTYTSKDFMDPMDAKALVRATLQRELGRDPTQAEYEDFISSIHGAEAHDQSSTTQTTTTDEQGRVVNQSSVSHQGMTGAGISQLALEKAQRNPDWAEWQAMGIYAPALFQALSSTVPGT